MEDIYIYIMDNIGEVSIIVSAIAIISSLIVWICDGMSMRIKPDGRTLPEIGDESANISFKPSGIANKIEPPIVSILVPCHNQGDEVKSMLEEIFKQSFTRYEVVVVDMASTDNTADVIRVISEDHKNVRHTFVPASTICVNHDYLALVLGLRLARTPWVLFLPVGASFSRTDSLGIISSYLDDEHDFALIFANSRSEYNNMGEKRIANRSFKFQFRTWRIANSGSLPWSGSSIVAMRRSVFSKSNGLETPIPKGARPLDVMVAELSSPERNIIIKNPATAINVSPSQCYLHTRHTISSKSSRKFKFRLAFSRIALFISILCLIAIAGIVTLNITNETIPTIPVIVSIILGLISIISVTLATAIVTRKSIRTFTTANVQV